MCSCIRGNSIRIGLPQPFMNTTSAKSPMDKAQSTDTCLDPYWIEVPDLTIYHAAFWMQLGSDPRRHEYRCDVDEPYRDNFYYHPGGYEAVFERCGSLFRAINLGQIGVSEEVRRNDQELDFKRTRILKSDWIDWCRKSGNSALADRFSGIPSSEQTSEQPSADKGLTKRERQIQAIEAAAKELKYPLTAIPDGGKQAIKLQCMSKHAELFGAGDDPFKDSWQEAVKQNRIRMKNHEQYAKR